MAQGIKLSGPRFTPPISRMSIPPASLHQRTTLADTMKGRKFPISQLKLPQLVKKAFPQAKTISDSPVSIRVRVTGQDCQGAMPLRPETCAMARAVQRELEVDGAVIGMGVSYLLKGTHLIRFHTPQTLAREITTFDRHGDFQPGYYGLSSVSKSTGIGRNKKPRTGVLDGSRPRRIPMIHKRTEGTRSIRHPEK